MARKLSSRSRGSARATGIASRAWPILLAGYERWQSLSDEEKERYRQRAREFAERGREAFETARSQPRRKRRFGR